MGRLTELFNTVQTGFKEDEDYHWLDITGPDREVVKEMRKDKDKTLFD